MKTYHRHRFKLVKQTTLPMLTYHNWYLCKCGEEKEDYENPWGHFTLEKKVTLNPDFYKTNYSDGRKDL